MNRLFASLVVSLALATGVSAQITVPNTLTAGAVIRAAELNTNFSAIADKSLNRITGGTIEGNITVNADVTIDGIDISDFLRTTGEVRAQTSGTVSAPSFSRSGDTSTGFYFPDTGEVGISLSGTERLALDAAGLTVFGVNIINSDGKIPALSSTYFDSLSGANLTSLNASNISSGTLADGRLSSNVPLIDASTNAFTGNATIGGTLGITGTTTAAAINAGAVAVDTLRVDTSTTAGFVLTADGSGNATWQDVGAAAGNIPSGMIAIFDTTCPVTWTRVSAFDNKFLRGGATYAAVGGGSDTHTHNVDPAPVTSAAGGSHSHTVDPANTATTSGGSHSHGAVTGAGGAHSHLSNGGTSETGSHSHTGTTDNAGSHTHGTHAVQQGGDADSFPAANSSAGDHNHSFSTSSSGSHEHNITDLPSSTSSTHTHSITSDSGHTHSVDIASTSTTTASTHTHSVDVVSTATTSGANVPAYSQVLFCKKD